MTRTITPSRLAATLALAASAWLASPAQAQVEGWYSGIASDGSQFSLYVQRDMSGALQLNTYAYYGNITCPSGAVRHENSAFGALAPAQPHIDIETPDESFYTRLVGDFSADSSTFTGWAVMTMPKFVDVGASTKRTESCTTGKRRVVATLSAFAVPGMPAALPRGQWLRMPAAR